MAVPPFPDLLPIAKGHSAVFKEQVMNQRITVAGAEFAAWMGVKGEGAGVSQFGGGKELGWDSDERRIQCDSNATGHSDLNAIVLLSVPKLMPLHRERSHLEHPTPKTLRLSQPPLINEADTQKQTLHRRLREIRCPRPPAARGPRRTGAGRWGPSPGTPAPCTWQRCRSGTAPGPSSWLPGHRHQSPRGACSAGPG